MDARNALIAAPRRDGLDGVGGAGPVAPARVGGTQVRARFHHFAGNGSGTPRSGLCSRSALRGYTTTLLPSGERRIFPATFSSPSRRFESVHSRGTTQRDNRIVHGSELREAEWSIACSVGPAPRSAVHPCDDAPPWGNPVTGMNLHHPMMAPFLGMAANRAPPAGPAHDGLM